MKKMAGPGHSGTESLVRNEMQANCDATAASAPTTAAAAVVEVAKAPGSAPVLPAEVSEVQAETRTKRASIGMSPSAVDWTDSSSHRTFMSPEETSSQSRITSTGHEITPHTEAYLRKHCMPEAKEILGEDPVEAPEANVEVTKTLAEITKPEEQKGASETEAPTEKTWGDWANGDDEDEESEEDEEYVEESEKQFDFSSPIETKSENATPTPKKQAPTVLKDLSLTASNSPRNIVLSKLDKAQQKQNINGGKKKKKRNKGKKNQAHLTGVENLNGSPATLQRAAVDW